ncbi:hypothetical protein Droror1_Dr00019043 [Drosera rotundifolia]
MDKQQNVFPLHTPIFVKDEYEPCCTLNNVGASDASFLFHIFCISVKLSYARKPKIYLNVLSKPFTELFYQILTILFTPRNHSMATQCIFLDRPLGAELVNFWLTTNFSANSSFDRPRLRSEVMDPAPLQDRSKCLFINIYEETVVAKNHESLQSPSRRSIADKWGLKALDIHAL